MSRILSHGFAVALFLLASMSSGLRTGSKKAPARRTPNCANEFGAIPSFAESLYQIGNLTNGTMNFDSLAVLSGVRNGAVDLSEFMNTAKLASAAVEEAVANGKSKDTTFNTGLAWNKTWYTLAQTLEAEGDEYSGDEDMVSAADAYQRASSYYNLGIRFAVPLDGPAADYVYTKSKDMFHKFLKLKNQIEGRIVCTPVSIPYTINATNQFGQKQMYSGTGDGLWCPGKALPGQDVTKMPTAIVLDGYDGTIAMLYQQQAKVAEYGINQLFVDGPGQGAVARFQKQPFVPDFNLFTSTVLDYVLAHNTTTFLNVNSDLIFCWGVSFGGYLAPRSFAFEPRFAGLVADGGVYDMYDVMACAVPANLFGLYLAGDKDEEFNQILSQGADYSLQLAFAVYYGQLGFNVTGFSNILDNMAHYTMKGNMMSMTARPVAVNTPAWDTLTQNQSNIFWDHLIGEPTPVPGVNPMSTQIKLNPYRGAGLHCGIGSTSNQNIAIARWINKVTKFLTGGAGKVWEEKQKQLNQQQPSK